ncbi:hypothetical protein PtB15_6B415 [Puccinia triticina]|nr:hypothetical protein PtB15_6B415 [Puccinia triticina]
MHPPSQNLYNILELPQTASRAEIRAAYHRLAKQTHPDKNPDADPAGFQALQQAYETLSDPQQRAEYDARGGPTEKTPPAHPFHGAAFEELFTSMFRDELPAGFFASHPFLAPCHPPPWTPAPEAKSPDTRIEFQATLHDLVNGRTVLTDIPRQVGCQACNATGFHPNAALRQCRRCDGRGYQTSTQSSYGLFTHTQSTCASCGGAGSKMSSDDCCAQCRGSCIITETAVVEWEIAKGMLPGQTITLPGMGNALPGHLPGDVVIRLRVAPHPAFEIVPPDSRDLLLSVSITLSEALLGMDRVLFRHLDGREIRICLPGPHQEGHQVISHGDLRAIRGMGLPPQSPAQPRGDLWLKFIVESPSPAWLRAHDLALLRSALPPCRQDIPHSDAPQEYASLESAVVNKV